MFKVTEQGNFVPWSFTPEEAMKSIAESHVKFIDLQFTDVPGRLRHVTLPTEMMEKKIFKEGVGKLDGSSVKGFVEIQESDMILAPDPSTYGIVPWIEDGFKTARFICDIKAGYGQGRFSRDPRYVAQKAAERIRSEGFTSSLWGLEVEFFVFNSVTWEANDPFSSGYKISSVESANEARGTNFPIRFKDGYYPAQPVDTLSDYRSECVNDMRDGFGVLSNAHHHEVATAGQCEIDMRYGALVKMADNCLMYKYIVKNVSKKNNMVATFIFALRHNIVAGKKDGDSRSLS
jgi:glutamine synthetase